MQNGLSPDHLDLCFDGVGADICDKTVIPPSIPKNMASRKYTVRYIIPTVSSNDALDTNRPLRNMSVSANSAEDAVRTVLAAHPDADISCVE